MVLSRKDRRCGAALVEAAFVLPILVFLLLAIIVGGLGISRYQRVEALAAEAARWAAVRGSQYREDTNNPSPTQQDIFQQAVLPFVGDMDPNQISIQVQWIDSSTGNASDWNGASKNVNSITPLGVYATNRVRVTVSYLWIPGVLVGPQTFARTCERPMAN